jgi:hypothetical protein
MTLAKVGRYKNNDNKIEKAINMRIGRNALDRGHYKDYVSNTNCSIGEQCEGCIDVGQLVQYNVSGWSEVPLELLGEGRVGSNISYSHNRV